VDNVVSVMHSERVLILKMVLDNGLINVSTVYASHSGKLEEEKESFWNELFHLVSCIPQNEMVVLADDMNVHVGSSNVGCDGMHVIQMDTGSWSLHTHTHLNCTRHLDDRGVRGGQHHTLS